MKYYMSLAALAIVLSSGTEAVASPITLPTSRGPQTFDTTDFANALINSRLDSAFSFGLPPPPLPPSPLTPATAAPLVLGPDIRQGLALGPGTGAGPDFIDLTFGHAVGPTLVVWEAGSPPDPFSLAVSTNGGATFSPAFPFTPAPTVPPDFSSGFLTNTAFVDTSIFGLFTGGQPINAIRISDVSGSHPDILAVAAVAIPEPGTLLPFGLMALGLLGDRWRRWKRGAA